ncbi:DUF3037 domain-containing protein [Prosthecobacter sp.]|uniref:DUF3037 domain-containing protein n=1 Tax=Prosthecobacter sp. TaxID=1965333 RepID=UPI001D735D3D|nr:DUF3037 domain-containing protein [Prosthecobacter sp.]MCB1278573.1 DUF3037 domain-containing protein [Prosthecobacter sp.]
MNQHLCKYAVVRFLPYRETEEFVNVGVLVLCEELGYLGFLLEKRRSTRVTDFFDELDGVVYRQGIKSIESEITRLSPKANASVDGCLTLSGGAPNLSSAFNFLVRPRKTLFHFSDVRVAMTPDPSTKLKELFGHYVRRQFAQPKEYQEQLMREAIHDHLKQWDLSKLYQPLEVGTDIYRMKFPFVHQTHAVPVRAIRALHLNLRDTTEILRKGDQVVGGLRRIKEGGELPDDCLVVVKSPKPGNQMHDVAQQVCEELLKLDVLTASYSDRDSLQAFAARAKTEQ